MKEEKQLFRDQLSLLALKNWKVVGETLHRFVAERKNFDDLLSKGLDNIDISTSKDPWEATILDKVLNTRSGLTGKKGEQTFKILFTAHVLDCGYIQILVYNNKIYKYEEKHRVTTENKSPQNLVDEIIRIIKAM